MASARTNKDELLLKPCEGLASDPEVAAPDWRKIVMVGVVQRGSRRMHGFCFDTSGDWHAAAPRNFDALHLLQALRDAMAEDDTARKPWVTCLLKIGAAGKIGAEFEYEDPARRTVTPANHARRVEEFAALPI